MGLAAPTRPSRGAFGPTYKNPANSKVTKPTEEIDASIFNALFWQLAGVGACGPMAWALLKGSDGSRLAGGEMWNPNADPLLQPACTRTSTGIYVVTLNATYPDETGVSIQIGLFAGFAFPQAFQNGIAAVTITQNRIATVNVTAGATNTLTDSNVLVFVL